MTSSISAASAGDPRFLIDVHGQLQDVVVVVVVADRLYDDSGRRHRHAWLLLQRGSARHPRARGEPVGVLNFSAIGNVSGLKLPEVEMSLFLVVCLAIGAPLAGLGLHDLQASLERWDQKRHAED